MAARPASCAQSAVPAARCQFPRESPLARGRRLLEERSGTRRPLRRSADRRPEATSASMTWREPRSQEGARPVEPEPSVPTSGPASAWVPPAWGRSPAQARPAPLSWPTRGPTPSAWVAPAAGRPPPEFRRLARRCRSQVVLRERSWPTQESSRAWARREPVPRAARIPASCRILIPNRSSV
jgi:hypothetical protein